MVQTAICNTRAAAAGLPGIYKAWLANNTVGPASRFNPKPTVPYKLPTFMTGIPGGSIVRNSYNDLITFGTLLSLMTLTEFGLPAQINTLVWTNVNTNGTPTATTNDKTCSEWNSNSSGNGHFGLWSSGASSWTRFGFLPCNAAVHLYCFEQAEEPQTVIQHYKCHKVDKKGGKQKFPSIPDVNLVDQFGETTVSVEKPVTFCNPVDKEGEGIPDDTAHLTCYDFKEDDNVPAFEKIRVSIDNQFAESQEFTLLEPTELCVPTEEDDVPSNLGIDHFKCYKVDKKSVKKGFDPAIVVSLEDQFESVDVKVGKAVSVCYPVDKNNEGVKLPDDLLTCYNFEVLEDREFNFTVSIDNQFDMDKELRLKEPGTLCVPSLKTELE